MIRLFVIIGTDFAKFMRLPATYVGPLLLVLLIFAASFIHPIAKDGQSDYDFISFSTSLAVNVVGFFLVLLFSAALIVSESERGTMRMLLVRPIRRSEALLSKFVMGCAYGLVLAVAAATSAWGTAYLFGDLAGVRFGEDLVYTDAEMRVTYVACFALSFAPLVATVSFGLFISAVARSTTAAIAVAVCVWLIVESIKFRLDVERWVFSSYLERTWQVFADRSAALDAAFYPDALFNLVLSLSAIAVFLGLALIAFVRKDFRT